jgi:hypothetical protein
VASVVIGVVIAMAITHGLRWKVSLHLGGAIGSVTVFVLLFEPLLLVVTPLVVLVGWAHARRLRYVCCRLRARAPTGAALPRGPSCNTDEHK